MFTGLIEAVGKVRSVTRDGKGARIVLEAPFAGDLKRGDSVAVSGACLTAIDLWPDAFSADVSNETLARTAMGGWRAGVTVNLERALAVGQRLGGHYVLGHVDGLGRIANVSALGDAWRVDVAFPPSMAPLFIDKGSVAIDGISLTVNEVGPSSFWVAVIPETQARTTLEARKVGDAVHLEGDVLGKYVLRALATTGRSGGLTLEKLAEAGYV
jgi:riboflavin synthase